MQKTLQFILVIVTCVAHSGCEMNKQSIGAAVGTAVGALAGAKFTKDPALGVGMGALAGSFVGSQIGKTMDEYDRKMMQEASQRALELAPSGSQVAWKNPDSGNSGTITPIKTFQESGRYCREYTQEVVIGGERQKAYGKACRKPDGHWEIIE